jgi:Uma2 family endonuclease
MNTTTPEPQAPPVEETTPEPQAPPVKETTRAVEHEPRLRRFTVAEYHAMGRAGILGEDDRVELIDGHVRAMSPIGAPHIRCVSLLNRLLHRLLIAYGDDALLVNVQGSIRLNDYSEPEPDASVFRLTEETKIPTPEDVLLVVEVSDTTLAYDRRVKLPRYAAAGIPEVWIVNLRRDEVEVYRTPRPDDATYASKAVYAAGDTLTLAALPDAGSVAVAGFMPAPERT